MEEIAKHFVPMLPKHQVELHHFPPTLCLQEKSACFVGVYGISSHADLYRGGWYSSAAEINGSVGARSR
jgi:hypothetical protein